MATYRFQFLGCVCFQILIILWGQVRYLHRNEYLEIAQIPILRTELGLASISLFKN